jgi:hypothetical protein
MSLLDHVALQVDDLNVIGAWYDRVVSVAGGARTFDTPNLLGYALPGQPTQLLFSLATDPVVARPCFAVFIRDPAGNNLEFKRQASTARPTL